ncbi:type II toxin-antitoxin system PemK/MazF family toxin [Enterococcus faecalis]|nr:type II toxin-antitoxin system PemK/MazF family toxin [Enterococcus faecalis]HED5714253.1 type II toxin-antitoxin system PemK/MazF family toxin [Campylobacter jejuni]ELZ4686408.1 type II toxin-antitoxin system PemK/MazF family toxin [Enterococcus faecalis]MBB6650151.1 type II toxin-antitoxin system PemK/MazF family toxin [Enterococcus faecalis]MBV6961795.1 type II toxin-antitoxin system PemK/MazF family toxin [Enterococcus faecalis]MCU2218015.1 type II toxin-antitoxin system PemK/MazF famil
MSPMLSDIMAEVYSYLWDESTVYETANWMLHHDRWVNNTHSSNFTNFKRGDIVTIELGATNFRYEPSYEHPGVILFSRKFFSLIVPCSTQKYGKGFPEIIDANETDGFKSNTGIQCESFRWVSNNRIINKKGKVSNRVLDAIDGKILKLIPTYRKESNAMNKKLKEKEEEIKQLKEEIAELKK